MRLITSFRALAVLIGLTVGAAGSAPAAGRDVEYAFTGGGDGGMPDAELIVFSGKLYGTTQLGGSSTCNPPFGCGAVFSFDPATGTQTVVHAFAGGKDGSYPSAGLIAVGGKLYGTTVGGGAHDQGTVFYLEPTTGAEKVVYPFKGGSDGADPETGLTSLGGRLYGTTDSGGVDDAGTVFSVDPATRAETVLYAFKGGGDGFSPLSRLTVHGGLLYGAATNGGLRGGTLFSVDLASGGEAVVYTFKGGADGLDPRAGLTRVGARLFGTTPYGGGSPNCANGCGTIFSVRP